MIEKVVDRIGELDEPHLKLVVMHDFIWALIVEQASDRAHQHQVKNQDSRWDICQVESKAHSILQDVIAQALHLGRPTVCDYVKDRVLTVDVLWEVVYRVFREALCFDLLEDFNAMEADLMELKDSILSIWKAKDKCKTSSLRPTFVPLSASEKKKSTLGDTFSPSSATEPAPIHQSLFSRLSYVVGGVQSSLTKPMGLPPGIPYPLVSTPYGQDVLPTPGYTPWGSVMGYNFDPMTGQPLRPAVPYSYSFMSHSSDILLSTSFHPSLVDLPPLVDEDDEETPPLVVGPPSYSSCVVMSGAVPTVTVSSAGAETLLSTSPRANPRMSTSIVSSANQDVYT